MSEFTRDPDDWLRRLSPDEWIRAALGELRRATSAYGRRDLRAGVVGLKRAAGMALNGALLVEPKESWGRTYIEHVEALAKESDAPEAVKAACRTVIEAVAPSGEVVRLRTPRGENEAIEAARDVIAHAWVVVKRHEKREG